MITIVTFNIIQWCNPLTIDVLEKLWLVEELRNELLHVKACFIDVIPRARDREELAVGIVKPER